MDFILRPWRREDVDDVLRYANNEEIACNLRDVFRTPIFAPTQKRLSGAVSRQTRRSSSSEPSRWTAAPWAASPCAWAAMCTA